MKTRLLFVIFNLLIGYSCSSQPNWTTYKETISAGFTISLKYPDKLVVADIVDNCRCIGDKLNTTGDDPIASTTNTRQWCICMQDTADNSIDNLVSSWRTVIEDQVTETRDTIKIDNLNAIRVTLKSANKENPYRQLVYFKKFSTLFEIMNIYEVTNKDFQTFCKSIKIEKIKPATNSDGLINCLPQPGQLR